MQLNSLYTTHDMRLSDIFQYLAHTFSYVPVQKNRPLNRP